MGFTMSKTVNKEKYFIIFSLCVWIFFAVPMWDGQVMRMLTFIRGVCPLNPQQKNEVIDGGFYYFMEYCRALIPENTDILFKIEPSEPEFRSRDYYESEYFVGKSPYYLYPRRIFRPEDRFLLTKYTIIYNFLTKSFILLDR